MATYKPYSHRRLVESPQTFKEWWFTFRWECFYRKWKPSRQKEKAYDRDLEAYRKTGRKPW